MQRGCCNWCHAIVEAPDDYDRRVHRLYCCTDCLEKDWLFRRWQNDTWLNIVAEMNRGSNQSQQED